MGYREDIAIDTTNLDMQWVELPQLIHDYGQEIANLSLRRNQAKTALEAIDAKIYNELRSTKEKGGLTENAIRNKLVLDKRHQTKQEELYAAQKDLDIVQAALVALQIKKTALDNLTRLYLSGYYGALPSGSSREVQDHGERRIKEEQTRKLKGNTRIARKPSKKAK